ncbi:MAG: putative glycoside hydrolase [Acetobacter sp.]|nr:putative glycoside hydrolase [Bacteroides sp.]MCM1340437.1 putative glycoside hydrolase [Acetobacter sp.]MCM1432916.1 putative glycoside hydrolase [Clostridiales bacterium]
MKKKRFYNNKKRGEKWTEEVKGRKINFADKYIEAGNGSDKFDNRRPTVKKPIFTRDNFDKLLKRLIIAVLCCFVIGIGYTIMDVNIQRNAMPENFEQTNESADISKMELNISAKEITPLAMDGGVMLTSITDELQQQNYISAMFDLKRDDGTISYLSRLATIETYKAVSSPANDLEKSISFMLENDVLPVARICCYKDNIAPNSDLTTALISGGKLYRDSSASTYLSPNSDSAYGYIKSIIEEASGMGITVFALDYCDLPEELSASFDDGFEKLASKLYADIDSNIKLLEVKHISINSKNSSAIEKELEEKKEKNSKNIIYYISAKNKDNTKKALDNIESISYIMAE